MTVESIATPTIQRFPRWRYHVSPWSIAALVVVLVLLQPVLTVALSLIGEQPESWAHIRATVLSRYLLNTMALVLGIGCLTAVIGLGAAWLVTFYQFPGVRVLSWALALPFAIPTYIAAFAYAGLFDFGSPLQRMLSGRFGTAQAIDIMNVPGVILVVSMVLYPYVYLITRASLQRQSGRILEASRSLGRHSAYTFFYVGLPLARPALAGGVTLVIMEVLNEYGAMHYYGVDTFTTGIFKVWFGMNDTEGALRLAATLMCLVFAVLLAERAQRGRRQFTTCCTKYRPVAKRPLRGSKAALATFCCLLPVVLGFLLPVYQLLLWLSQSGATEFGDFAAMTAKSFSLAAAAAVVSVTIAVLIVYAMRLHRTPLMTLVAKATSLGYAMPGAVIAIGVMVFFVQLDRGLIQRVGAMFGQSPGLLLSGTALTLLFAYTVRFLTVAVNPIESGFDRLCGSMDNASLSLGQSRLHTLLHINLPLAWGPLLAGGCLVFVDVLKELPLTLILRPFNFETLATKTFQLAGEEMVAQSACGALLIVAAGIVPIVLVDRLMAGKKT